MLGQSLTYGSCSFFRLITRVLAQAIFLTPKPTFIPPFPKHRPYIGAIVGPNLICLLLHLFTVGSEASETMRGYLHGGIIIDLIGQKGPTSKLHLALLDILIAALQCFMLAVHVERERLKAVLKGKTDQPAQVRVASSQDLDAEERGVRQAAVDSGGDIELQEISAEGHSDSSSEHELDDHAEDRERLLAEPGVQQDSDEEDTPLDIFYSGTVIIAEFHIISTLRNQWVDYADATASALQTMGYSAQYAATTSNREISAASRRVQRNVESLAGQ